MWEILLKIAFYLIAGFVLVVASVWYVRSAYAAITGTGEVVIVPFAMVGADEDKDTVRGTALARMLQAHLQTIENDLATSQRELTEESMATARTSSAVKRDQDQARTALLPMLFVEQGASLQTRLLEPTRINVTVGGVEVGGIVPWLQRLLANRRSLEFSLYEGETKVSVACSLQVLGLTSEGLRVDLPKASGAKVDWDDVTAEVAYEVIRRRLARAPSNRVEVLSHAEFRTLVGVMREVATLNRYVALGRPVRDKFAAELQKIEPLARGVPEWHQLNALAASIAESADDKIKALDFYRNIRDALDKAIGASDALARVGLQKELNRATGKITALESHAQVTVALTSADSTGLEQIRKDARAAADAFNKIFGVQLDPPPVTLLPREDLNAYFDGKTFKAPKEIAKIPDITHHNVTWQYLEKYVPMFGDRDPGPEASAVAYSYSEILPMLLKQKGLGGWSGPQDWTLYAGGVAWIRGGDEKAIAADRRPLRSFTAPGTAYKDPDVGQDTQIGHIKDLVSPIVPQSACGIGNKAFYEAAQALGPDRAWEIWFEALKQVSKEKRITVRKWGEALLAAAGPDHDKLVAALKTVGLGVETESVGGGQRRRK
jgi:hypothetical protein